MRRVFLLPLSIALALASGAGNAHAVSCTLSLCEFPTLATTFGGSVSPKRLPTAEYAPVDWSVFGKIETRDGTHPSALREAIIDIDKDVKINAKGYPVCKASQLEGRDTKAALEVCGDALVGGGTAEFNTLPPTESLFSEPRSALGDLLPKLLTVFNGGESGGKVKLLIHFSSSAPDLPVAVGELKISRSDRGLHVVASVPVVVEGRGSLVDFNFKLGKTYRYKGKKVGYFEAKCPDGVFEVNVPKALFKNEAHTPGVAAITTLKGGLAVPCTPKG